MKRFYNLAGVLSLSEEENKLIERQAQEGDPVACFKQAEIYLHLHGCDDYVSSAHKLLRKASEGGVADADAAIAIMMIKGEIEPYDPTAAVRLLEKAITAGMVTNVTSNLLNRPWNSCYHKMKTHIGVHLWETSSWQSKE